MSTAQFPTQITDQLYEVVSRLATTLTADISDTDETIPVASTAGFPAKGFVTIDSETIHYTSLGVNSLICTGGRGFSGTATSHLKDTQVKLTVAAEHFNRFRVELIATQEKVGISGSTDTNSLDYKIRNLPAQGTTAQVTNLNANYLQGKTVIDEDDMASNLDTAVPTQQSVKAYVDTNAGVTPSNAVTLTNKTIINPTISFTDKTITMDVKAKAYLLNAQSITASTYTIINLDSIDYDVGSDFDTEYHRFVVPVTGYYLITGKISFGNPTNGYRYVTRFFDGTNALSYAVLHAAKSDGLSVILTDILYLTSEMYVYLQGYGETNVSIGYGSNSDTFLAIHLLSL